MTIMEVINPPIIEDEMEVGEDDDDEFEDIEDEDMEEDEAEDEDDDNEEKGNSFKATNKIKKSKDMKRRGENPKGQP
jgi:hypothetical protein